MRRLPAAVACTAAAVVVAALLSLPVAAADWADDEERPDWREGDVPPAPAWSAANLIEVELPGRSVRVGVDPATITLDKKSGVVRYVAVARGISSVSASYEGIRCASGEWRTYARQTPGQPWVPAGSSDWQAMRDARSPHAHWLAGNGMCPNKTTPADVSSIVRRLKNGRQAFD